MSEQLDYDEATSRFDDRRVCPRCGGDETEGVGRDWMAGCVQERRVCVGCESQYVAEFGAVVKRIERHRAEAFQS